MANYFFPILLILLVWQCQDEAHTEVKPQHAALGKAFTLEQGEQVKLAASDSMVLELMLEEVKDSRCPEDVVCVWLGNATAIVRISYAANRGQKVSFCIGDCRPDPVRTKHTIAVEVGEQEYEVILLEVSPYPNTNLEETAKHVKLLVNKID
ncbi:hypothetical protein PKOR_10735 [Pontibacter korlensis]|uniref:Uncharacterized protein n=1 Tax=Pontibacter korlensis TaxID=400092 RepID=A0A0E3ZFH6_9BACT|nr:hypothetical protein [Pontibacter korlensis]AKD03519.1 hypothetical protein PKOR_10735 [Pontibacter korlensis]